jgi:HlyD family secretion protein
MTPPEFPSAAARRFPVAWLAAGLIVAGGGFWTWHRRPAALPLPPVAAGFAVSTEPVQLRRFDQALALHGTVVAREMIVVGADVPGLRLRRVMVEVGDRVRPGQPLAQLDDGVLRLQVAQARAQLARGKAEQRRARHPYRPQELSGLEAGVLRAQAVLSQAKDAHDRVVALQGRGDSTVEELMRRQADLRVAEAELRQARLKVEMARAGSRQEDLQAADAEVAVLGARLSELELQLGRTVVRAPAAGLVVRRTAPVGTAVVPTQSLFEIVQDGRYEVAAKGVWSELKALQSGQPAAVTDDAGLTLGGAVRLVEPALDAASKLATVRVALPAYAPVRLGMLLQVAVDTGVRQLLSVPEGALMPVDHHLVVFVRRGDRVQERPVVVSARIKGRAGIRQGLQAGEEVVVAGAGFLKDGDLVRVASGSDGAAAP